MGEYDETAAGETSVSEVSVPLAFWRIQSRDARFATSSAFVFRDEVAQYTEKNRLGRPLKTVKRRRGTRDLLAGIKALLRPARPFGIHREIMLRDVPLYADLFFSRKVAATFHDGTAICPNEELGGKILRHFLIARMNVHRLNRAMRREIEIVIENLVF